MAQEKVKEFIRAINKSPQLQADSRSALEGSSDASGFVALGKRHGYDFTPEEAQSYFHQALGVTKPEELSDADLEKMVSGGGCKAPAAIGSPLDDVARLMQPIQRVPVWTGFLVKK